MEGYIRCCFFLCLVTDISATVAPIGVKLSMMIYIGPGQIFSRFGGGDARVPKNPKFWPSKNKYLENGNSQHCMSIRRGLFKNVLCNSRVGSPPPSRGVHYKQKNMLHFWAFLHHHHLYKREIYCCMVERRLCITSCRSTQSAAHHARAAFVYHESSIDTIGRTPCECSRYFQQ